MGIGVFPRTETIGLGRNKTDYITLDSVQQQASGIFILFYFFHLLNHCFILFAAL